jgi:DNA-directed RNA polymerase
MGGAETQFIQRYGDNCIPIANAKALKKSATIRTQKEQARRERFRAVLGAEQAPDVDAAADSTEALLAEASVDVMGAEPGLTSDSEAEPDILSVDDIQDLVGGDKLNIFKVGTQSFIKVKDLLPPKPVRGNFDVQKIRNSSYFFS